MGWSRFIAVVSTKNHNLSILYYCHYHCGTNIFTHPLNFELNLGTGSLRYMILAQSLPFVWQFVLKTQINFNSCFFILKK